MCIAKQKTCVVHQAPLKMSIQSEHGLLTEDAVFEALVGLGVTAEP